MRLSNRNGYNVQLAVEEALGGYSLTLPDSEDVIVGHYASSLYVGSIEITYSDGTSEEYTLSPDKTSYDSMLSVLGKTINHVESITLTTIAQNTDPTQLYYNTDFNGLSRTNANTTVKEGGGRLYDTEMNGMGTIWVSYSLTGNATFTGLRFVVIPGIG